MVCIHLWFSLMWSLILLIVKLLCFQVWASYITHASPHRNHFKCVCSSSLQSIVHISTRCGRQHCPLQGSALYVFWILWKRLANLTMPRASVVPPQIVIERGNCARHRALPGVVNRQLCLQTSSKPNSQPAQGDWYKWRLLLFWSKDPEKRLNHCALGGRWIEPFEVFKAALPILQLEIQGERQVMWWPKSRVKVFVLRHCVSPFRVLCELGDVQKPVWQRRHHLEPTGPTSSGESSIKWNKNAID